jgi:hypothetical protein
MDDTHAGLGEVWWAALLAQAQANRDLAAALLRVVPYQSDCGVCPTEQLEVWYAAQDASSALRVAEDNVAAADAASSLERCPLGGGQTLSDGAGGGGQVEETEDAAGPEAAREWLPGCAGLDANVMTGEAPVVRRRAEWQKNGGGVGGLELDSTEGVVDRGVGAPSAVRAHSPVSRRQGRESRADVDHAVCTPPRQAIGCRQEPAMGQVCCEGDADGCSRVDGGDTDKHATKSDSGREVSRVAENLIGAMPRPPEECTLFFIGDEIGECPQAPDVSMHGGVGTFMGCIEAGGEVGLQGHVAWQVPGAATSASAGDLPRPPEESAEVESIGLAPIEIGQKGRVTWSLDDDTCDATTGSDTCSGALGSGESEKDDKAVAKVDELIAPGGIGAAGAPEQGSVDHLEQGRRFGGVVIKMAVAAWQQQLDSACEQLIAAVSEQASQQDIIAKSGKKSKVYKAAMSECVVIHNRVKGIVAAILPVIQNCCRAFCNLSGIAQQDVVVCFAGALIEARLFPVKMPYCKGGAWSGLGVEIDEFVASHVNAWVQAASCGSHSAQIIAGVKCACEEFMCITPIVEPHGTVVSLERMIQQLFLGTATALGSGAD